MGPDLEGGVDLRRFLQKCLQKRRSVLKDWRAQLSEEKTLLFKEQVRHWESGYGMLSVALDDGLTLRAWGDLTRAHPQAVLSSEILDRLAAQLVAALGAMGDHGRHFGTVAAVTPLDPEFFRSETAHTAAYWSFVLHRVLLSERARFFYKLRTLASMIEDLAGEFREATEEIVGGITANPEGYWDTFECLHDDFNTCLREAIVMLKSFLHVLPAEQLENLRRKLDAPIPCRPAGVRTLRSSS
jgi:hypothetical protein